MAIIYTYPKLNNPQGNELIVVSDVNNKNATRLVTIQSIASLIPSGGGGCDNAITGIQTPAGTYNSTLCSTADFTSVGGTITISNTLAGVNFEANCITNYVLKPVVCDGVDCLPSTSSMHWLFSCESSLAQYAGTNTPVILENNGNIVPHQQNIDPNNPTNCFYVEVWSPTVALATTCTNCCEAPPVVLRCLYQRCDGSPSNGEAREDVRNDQLPTCSQMPPGLILDKLDQEAPCPETILATDDEGGAQCCYFLVGEVEAPATPGYSYIAAADCNETPCVNVPDIKQYSRCQNACDFGSLPAVVYSNDITGSFVLLTDGVSQACYEESGNVPAPATPGIVQVSDLDPLNCETAVTEGQCKADMFVYERCSNVSCSGLANVPFVYRAVNDGYTPGDVVQWQFSDGSTCCFTMQEAFECELATQNISGSLLVEPTPEYEVACTNVPLCVPEEPGEEKWVYIPCEGVDCEEPLVSSAEAGIHAEGSSAFWYNCCYYTVPEGRVETALEDNAPSSNQIINAPEKVDCDTFAQSNQIEWLKCETEDEYIYTNCCETNDVLYLGFTATGFAGPTGCYTIVGLSANQDTVPCSAIEEVDCGDQTCLPEELKFQYRNCGSEEWLDTESDLTAYAPSDGIVYTWGDDDAPSCFEIRQNAASSGVGQAVDLQGYTDYSATQDPCACCANYNVVQYSQCDIANPAEGCSNMQATIYLINPNYPAQAPATALIQDNNGNACCYTLDGTSCENPTANYSFSGLAISGCNDEPCTAASPKFKFLYTQCAGSTSEQCASMNKDVILELEEGEDLQFLILDDGNAQECCYVKVEQVEEGEISNYTISGTFNNCDELPEGCIG